MQNKRGIAQAFLQECDALEYRPATVFDVFDMGRVWVRSIRDLCAADHLDDPSKIALWTANKDPATIRDRIQSGADFRVAARGDQILAIGGLLRAGEISLLYVDPAETGRGLGAALLQHMENVLRACGCAEATLLASKTALGFYHAHGWITVGDTTDWNGIPQFPLRKSLQVTE